MPETWAQARPLLSDNFEKIARSTESFQPRTFTTANNGGRPAAGVMLTINGVFSDLPQYDDFSTLTQELDIYVDSGVNATGTASITNNSGTTLTVTIGDYFALADDQSDPLTARLYVATSGGSILNGGSGSISVVAEKCGSRYDVSGATAAYGLPTIYNPYDTSNRTPIFRYVSITPAVPGAGGGLTITITATGGSGVQNDPNYRWPNGSSLSSAQKNLVVTEELLQTVDLPISWANNLPAPYTQPFATTIVNVLNNDSSAHSIYVYLSGKVFSGKPTYTINR